MTGNDLRLSRAERWHGRILRLYPAHFRARFAPGMHDAFLGELAQRRVQGTLAVVRLWAGTLAEAAWIGLGERWSPTRHLRVRDGERSAPFTSALAIDWRDAARSLRATPVVTAVAVLSIALGVGANTSLFSVLNSLVLKPLPVRDPARLLLIDQGSWTNPIWEEIRDRHSALFDGALAWSADRFDMADHGEAQYVDGAYASGRFFDVLGVGAVRGRVLTEADDQRDLPADGPAAVISYGFWQRHFAGSDTAIGQHLSLSHITFTVVGVTPRGFFGADVGRSSDVYIPLASERLIRGAGSLLDRRGGWWLEIMLRTKPHQSLEQATALLRDVQPTIREATLPTNWPERERTRYLTTPFELVAAANGDSDLRRDFALPLTALLIVVALVLLIACANIANVLMARATARRHEWSVRLAIGASRWRIGGQILAESLMIASAGGVLGLLLARLGAAALAGQLVNRRSGVYLDLSIDWRVFAFTATVTLVTAVLFGLGPALSATRVAPNDALKEQGRTVAGDRRFGVRNALVVAQVALSLVLVVAAGLFVRTFISLSVAPLGFTPDRLVLVNVALSQTPPGERGALVERLTAAAARVPGVRSAGASLITPLSGAGWNTRLDVPAEPEGSTGQRPPWVNGVTPGWFTTYGLHIVAGRDVAATDKSGAPPVAVVNETFVKRFYAGQNPIGQHLRAHLSDPNVTEDVEVVGVVSDSVYRSVREGFVATIFMPYAQAQAWDQVGIVASAEGGVAGVRRALAGALTREDPRTTFAFTDFPLAIRNTLTQEALVAQLSGLFGALALLLAGLGLYGVTAYSVNRRRGEIGVRMALGADARAIVRLVLGRVGVLVACGVVAGAVLSLWGARYVAASLLFNLPARDPATLVASAITLLAVGSLAGWLPARRAARIDPTRALREN